jgi:hypothetical protein
MGFFDKIMFWKKKELDFPEVGANENFGSGSGFKEFGISEGLGSRGDSTAGLGGTSDLNIGNEPSTFPQQPNFPQNIVPPQGTPPPSQPSFQQQGFGQQNDQSYTISKELEILSSKLDALRAGIESINQRLANLERIASGEQEEHKRYRW